MKNKKKLIIIILIIIVITVFTIYLKRNYLISNFKIINANSKSTSSEDIIDKEIASYSKVLNENSENKVHIKKCVLLFFY